MKYISILRGINVSGKNKIQMKDLKSLYELLGFKNVVTYIQSGNVIFDSSLKNKNELKAKIEKTIQKKYKFYVPVDIRTKNELDNIINNCPYKPVDLAKEGSKVMLTFLSSTPKKDKTCDVMQYVIAPDKLVIQGKEIYLYTPNGYGKSKLSNTFLEKKLDVTATTRNWRTIIKMQELST